MLKKSVELCLVEKKALKIRGEDRGFVIVLRDVDDWRVRLGRNAKANVIPLNAVVWLQRSQYSELPSRFIRLEPHG